VADGVTLRVMTEPQEGATYDDLLRVARATEDLGFDAFFRSDRRANQRAYRVRYRRADKPSISVHLGIQKHF